MVIIVGMVLTTIFGVVLLVHRKKASKLIADLNDDINRLTAANSTFNKQYEEIVTKLFVKERELFNMTTQKETLSAINKELTKKMNKDEKIEVTITGENSEVKIIDVDGAVTTKKRGRKPGSKKPFYKKKSGGKPS
jgi:hypothetical protein